MATLLAPSTPDNFSPLKAEAICRGTADYVFEWSGSRGRDRMALQSAMLQVVKQQPELTARLVAEPMVIDEATIALLRSWEAEDETNDPNEIERREKDWQEFRAAMNQHHSSSRTIYK